MKRRAAVLALAALWPSAVWAQRATFHGLGELAHVTEYSVVGISADGRVVIAHARGPEGDHAMRWTADAGLEVIEPPPGPLSSWRPRGISGDGSVIVVNGRGRAFRWTRATGMVDIGELPEGSDQVRPSGISADGSIIVGTSTLARIPTAFRWTEAEGMAPLFPGDPTPSFADILSGDGAAVIGDRAGETYRLTSGGLEMLGLGEEYFFKALSHDGSVAVGVQDFGVWHAFRWTATGDLHGIGTTHSEAAGVSADGSVVVGVDDDHFSDGPAFIWDTSRGLRYVQDVLIVEYGLDLSGWELRGATGVSADGTVVVGHGINPAGQEEGWVARLGNGTCYADCDASGEIDFFDFLCYQDSFAAAEPWADCDGTGALDVFDFLCFQNAFAVGCP